MTFAPGARARRPRLLRGRLQDACRLAAAGALTLGLGAGVAPAQGIYGTLSNFDVFNETPEPSEGFEIELEGVHSADVYDTYPSHYNAKSITDYVNGASFGTRITFEDYHFIDNNQVEHFAINPNPNPPNTNGHFAVNLPDCEHFGFAVNAQPAATRTYWLNKLPDGQYERIGNVPLTIPGPTWAYVPPVVPGGAPVVRAEVKVPEPAEAGHQLPDSVWMKVFKTETEHPVELGELMSGPGGIVPQGETETETEWELLEGGKQLAAEGEVGKNGDAVVRRYEFYKYTGPYDSEHEPTSAFLDSDLQEPPAGELGPFIAANMVAANLVPGLLPGDANGDGHVDLNDFGTLKANFGTGQTRAQGDFNGDAKVDLNDFGILKANFGKQGAVAAVPEPTGLCLMFAAAAGWGFALVRRGAKRETNGDR
ncbi:MAG: hypothetical protein U0836_14760 [Pirellulales bacterium]